MAGKQNFESLLEYIVNGEQAKAEELFHQLVVAKSREIYETLLSEEMEDEDMDEASEEEDEDMDEASEEDEEMDESMDSDEDDMDEMFNFEGDDEGEDDDAVGGDDDASDMEDELGPDGETDDDGMEFGDEEGEGEEPSMMDLKSDIEELKDMFQQMLDAERHEEEENPDIHGGMLPDEEPGMDDMGDEDEGMMMPFEEEIESIDLSPSALMREYVDKVGEAYKGGKVAGTTEGQPVGATNSSPSNTNKNSLKFSKNDMGGTVKNIAQGGTGTEVFAGQGELKGTGLLKGKPQDMNTGNVNKVGGTNVKQFYKNNTKGHGAEKKGSGEDAQNKKSIIGGK